MERHIRLLGILFIVWGALSILFGLGALILMVMIGAFTNGPHNVAIFATIALVFGGFSMATGILEIICGWGLLNRRNWSRMLTIVLAIVNVIDPPLGTALGVYALWVLFNPDSQEILQTA